ncbi:recA/radA recombinase [Vibrio ishigakensis]|uniref:RecA/radA recombinase n=1 Tax=Vibrio ishigakensis TaxID=1481914 RepID=A0A0B8QDN9_9VIBR|nr:recA/radA recombinase [Vibrio ishigakensis]
MQNIIDLLKRKQLIWQGSQQSSEQSYQPSYFPEWDQQLQGFPKTGVVEVQSPTGIGELRLLTPMLQATTQERLVVLINPPAMPSAHYFQSQGIDSSKVLILEHDQHALWAAEQSLKSGCCACVCLWHSQLEVHQARRLQVAAEQGQALNIHFNLDEHNHASLPIPLSVTLLPSENGLKIQVNKRRGGWHPNQFQVDFQQYWPELCTQKPEHQVIPFPLRRQKQA